MVGYFYRTYSVVSWGLVSKSTLEFIYIFTGKPSDGMEGHNERLQKIDRINNFYVKRGYNIIHNREFFFIHKVLFDYYEWREEWNNFAIEYN